jgi:glucose/arabinose dehydrogenase
MSAPVKLFAVAGMAIGLAIIALAKCSPPPKPGNPAFALTTVAQVNQPIAMAVRTGDDALYIAEWDGHVRAIRNGAVDPTPVLDISRLTRAEGERGLLGLAFSPDGKKLYLDYTDLAGDSHVDEFTMGANGQADPGSQRPILFQKQPFPNHNGGQLAFGPDGYLYIGLGDGGSGGDPQGNGQRLDTFLGKILRVDPTKPSGGKAYGIPPDNPFAAGGGLPEIWSYGLRNPWRFTFDKDTGDLWIADVGQGKFEEIDFAVSDAQGRNAARGSNFGWNLFEGNHSFEGGRDHAGFVFPVFEYTHSDGCSVTGGYRYRGTAMPNMVGAYLFADYCNNTIRVLSLENGVGKEIAQVKADPQPIVSFGEDAKGELYVLAFDGTVSRIDAPTAKTG